MGAKVKSVSGGPSCHVCLLRSLLNITHRDLRARHEPHPARHDAPQHLVRGCCLGVGCRIGGDTVMEERSCNPSDCMDKVGALFGQRRCEPHPPVSPAVLTTARDARSARCPLRPDILWSARDSCQGGDGDTNNGHNWAWGAGFGGHDGVGLTGSRTSYQEGRGCGGGGNWASGGSVRAAA